MDLILLKSIYQNKYKTIYTCLYENNTYICKKRPMLCVNYEYVNLEYLKKITNIKIPKVIKKINYENNIYLILTYFEGYDLFDAISINNFENIDIIIFLNQMLLIIKTLHDNNFAHRDIKPENIILCSDNTYVLIDFESGTFENSYLLNGTYGYISPTILDNNNSIYNLSDLKNNDIYALAVTTYFIKYKCRYDEKDILNIKEKNDHLDQFINIMLLNYNKGIDYIIKQFEYYKI